MCCSRSPPACPGPGLDRHPHWMTQSGDIKVVGLFTLAQVPWTFKFLWSPLMDRYPPPFMGRKRGWIFIAQVALLGLGLWMAAVSDPPIAVGMIGALTLATGLAAATQDIAIDAYAVEVLRREEQGAAVGARTAMYRAAMFISGGLAITLASQFDVGFFGRHLGHWPGPGPSYMMARAGTALIVTGGLPSRVVRIRRRSEAGGVGAVPRLPGPAPGARDPGLRDPLQAERQPHAGVDASLPRAGRLRRHGRGRGHGHHRAGGHPGRDVRRRPAHELARAGARALDLRLLPDRPTWVRARGEVGPTSCHVHGGGLQLASPPGPRSLAALLR